MMPSCCRCGDESPLFTEGLYNETFHPILPPDQQLEMKENNILEAEVEPPSDFVSQQRMMEQKLPLTLSMDKVKSEFFSKLVQDFSGYFADFILHRFPSLREREDVATDIVLQALEYNSSRVLIYLSRRDFSFNRQTPGSWTFNSNIPLISWAVKDSKFNSFNAILRTPGINLLSLDARRQSVLHYLALQDRKELADALTLCENSGVPRRFIDQPNVDGETPLSLAAYKGNYLAVQILIVFGANFTNLVNGKTPLRIATNWYGGQTIASKSIEVAIAWKQRALAPFQNLTFLYPDQPVHPSQHWFLNQLFFYLKREDHPSCNEIDYIIRKLSVVNVMNEDGDTPILALLLSKYSIDKKFDWVKALLDKGAILNVVNRRGESPLIVSLKDYGSPVWMLLTAIIILIDLIYYVFNNSSFN